MTRPHLFLASLAAVLCLMSPAAWAQTSVLRPAEPELRRGPFTLTPSLTVSEEFNDNIFLDNDNKESDFITNFTPGIALTLESETYRLSAAYNFTASVYAKNEERTRGFERQNFTLDAFYQVDPRLSFSLTDTFAFDTFTNRVSPEGVSAGRSARSYSNVISPGVAWRATPRTTVRGDASYALQRYGTDELNDSDIYRIGPAVEYAFTPRLSGLAGYEFGFYDIQRQANAVTHSPQVGASYQFTERVTGSLSGGPIFIDSDDEGEDRVVAGVTATLSERFGWGSLGFLYDRNVGTAGGLGGLTLNDQVGLIVSFTSLMRGLILEFSPRYTSSKSEGDEIDVDAFRLALQATYQINRWLNAVGGYEFFRQRSDGTLTTISGRRLTDDADQNRVYIGLQVAYPIRLD